MRRAFAMLLTAALALCWLVQGAGAAEDLPGLEVTEGVLVSQDPADYTDGQVLVLYTDNSCQVLSYSDDEALSEGLAQLAGRSDVALVQPNYSYTSTALTTDDPLGGQQWALANDGSFYMEEAANPFPVYDDPFGTPALPGQWLPPAGQPGMGQMGDRGAAAGQTTAAAGVDIGVETAWSIYDGGSRDVVIALIDTGVDTDHEDLSGILWVNEDEIPGNGIDDDGNGYVDDVNGWNFYHNSSAINTGSEDSHGTHGAGTIAARADNGVGIAGIVQSDHVKIMVLKVLGGEDGTGTTQSVIQAIQYAEANGASICNLSLGSEHSDQALYRAMAASSMLFVVAAGNDGANTDIRPSYPASYDLDNILSVANLSCDGTLHTSSNYGAVSVDLAAPGTYILSTTADGDYGYMTGTSMAAPMVTAAAAMVYSHFGGITLADVKEILLSSVQTLDSLEGITATGGMLDLGAAMACDPDTLPGTEWETVRLGSTTGGPVITAQLLSAGRVCHLLVQVSDADGDLEYAAYASGTRTAEAFRTGGVGRAFSLRWDGTALFTVYQSGTYTFYARDSAGNETVEVVTIE